MVTGSKIASNPPRLDPGWPILSAHGERGPSAGGAVSTNPETDGYIIGTFQSWAGANWFASFLSHPFSTHQPSSMERGVSPIQSEGAVHSQ